MDPLAAGPGMAVEQELRLIEAQCGAGLLNAFGAEREEQEVLREISRIAQLQSQIFRRCVDQVVQAAEDPGGCAGPEKEFEDMAKTAAKREQAISQVNSHLEKLSQHVTAVNDKVKECADRRAEQLAWRAPAPSPLVSRTASSLSSGDA
eukprot:EG_transcript_25273